jgi:hypothetical protein
MKNHEKCRYVILNEVKDPSLEQLAEEILHFVQDDIPEDRFLLFVEGSLNAQA